VRGRTIETRTNCPRNDFDTAIARRLASVSMDSKGTPKGILDWIGQFAALDHAVSGKIAWQGIGDSEKCYVELWRGKPTFIRLALN
jgi:hypothetical protein